MKVGPVKGKAIGIVGSRRRNSSDDLVKLIAVFFEVYKKGDTIVSGGCKQGGDEFAEAIARVYNIPIVIHYPCEEDLDPHLLWHNRKAAYAQINYARNTLIAQDCTILIALPSRDRTGGTEDTITKTLILKKKVHYV